MALEHGVPLAKATSDTAFADTDQVLDTGDTGLYTTPVQPMGIQPQQASASSSSSSFFHPLATTDATTLRDQLISLGKAADSDEAFTLLTFGVESSELTEGQGGISTFVWETTTEASLTPITDTNPPPVLDPTPTTSAEIDRILAAGAPNGDPTTLIPASLSVQMDRSIVADLMMAVERDVLSGTVTDELSWEQQQQSHYDLRDAHGETLLASLETSLLNEGAILGDVHGWAGVQDLEIPWNKINTIAALPNVRLVDSNDMSNYEEDGEIDQTGPDQGFSINGVELANLIQTKVYYDNGHEAQSTIGVVREGTGNSIHYTHWGFKDGNGDPRVTPCSLNPTLFGPPNCVLQDQELDTNPTQIPDPTSCAQVPWRLDAVFKGHANAVTSIMFGDISDGEHGSNWSAGSQGALKRSWVAREATGYGLDTDNNVREYRFIDAPSTKVDVLNSSFSASVDPADFCTHVGNASQLFTSSFEAGVFVVKSAGNQGGQDSCTITPPGAALGAFTVGNYKFFDANGAKCFRDDNIDCLTPAISGNSSSGPRSVWGSTRTILDIVAPTQMELLYTKYLTPAGGNNYANNYGIDPVLPGDTQPDCRIRFDSDTSDGKMTRKEWGVFGGTSAAAPVVSGAALALKGWARSALGSFINDPRHIFTSMLMMGDRDWDGSGTYGHRQVDFDGLWGAGLLRMRLFEPVGMDAPAQMSWGETCVFDGSGTVINLDPGRFTSKVDYIKAVAFHYDDDFHDTNQPPLDWVRMELQSRPTGTTEAWQTVRQDWSRDNRHRVFYDIQANTDYRLFFDGTNIESDNQGCGTDGTRVHFAVLTEDNARDDIDLDPIIEDEK